MANTTVKKLSWGTYKTAVDVATYDNEGNKISTTYQKKSSSSTGLTGVISSMGFNGGTSNTVQFPSNAYYAKFEIDYVTTMNQSNPNYTTFRMGIVVNNLAQVEFRNNYPNYQFLGQQNLFDITIAKPYIEFIKMNGNWYMRMVSNCYGDETTSWVNKTSNISKVIFKAPQRLDYPNLSADSSFYISMSYFILTK